jgi:hypothetical protein
MDDLGYRWIQRSGVMVILPCKRAPGQHLAMELKQRNAKVSADRIPIENFFGHWKNLLGIVPGTSHGDLKCLRGLSVQPSRSPLVHCQASTLSGTSGGSRGG